MKLKRRFGVVLLMAMLVMAMTVTASAAKKVKLNKKTASLSIGKTVVLKVKNAGKKKITWSSSNVNVAVVDDGVVTAVDAGTATIRADVKGSKTLKCKVTVKAAAPAETASVMFARYSTDEPRVILDGNAMYHIGDDTKALNVLVGSTTYDLRPHVETTPANAALTWVSSNEKVATVKDGVVTAVSNGTTKITASANGASDSIVVFVRNFGSDEDSNPVVITANNYDRVFNKFFEKVKVTTLWLDVDGNIINPADLDKAYIVDKNKNTVDLTDKIKKDFIEEKYYFVVKDPRVDALRSSGYGVLKYNIASNVLTLNGATPVLTPTNTKIGWTNGNTPGGAYYENITTDLDEVTLETGDIPFKYQYRVYNPETDKMEPIPEEAGRCHVTVSDPSLAGKTVRGFQYGFTKNKLTPWVETPKKDGKVSGKSTYYMWSYVDEVFTSCNFVLYLK